MEHLEESANGELNTITKNDKVVAELILEENSEVVRSTSVESLNSLQDPCAQKPQNQEKISVADVLCRVCTQLLFRPVVLNCGHGIYDLLSSLCGLAFYVISNYVVKVFVQLWGHFNFQL